MHQEKCNLKWHSYPDHLRNIMCDMMTSEEFKDVTLVSDDKKILTAHRNILSACSPVFKKLLLIEASNKNPLIYLRGIRHSDIQSILQFIYLGDITISEEGINEFLLVAKSLEIIGLSNNHEDENPEVEDLSFRQIEQELSEDAEFTNITNLSEASNEESKTDSPDQINHLKNEPISNDTHSYHSRVDQHFSVESSVKAHIGSKHENVEYQFDQSQQPLINQQILTKHGCNQCDYQATTQSNLTTHIQSKHDGVKYACNQCDYQARTQSHLKTHIQSKHEGVKYACNQCDYQGSEEALRYHFKAKH